MSPQAIDLHSQAEESLVPTEKKSVISKLIGIFIEPTATFKSVAANPRWGLPFIVSLTMVFAAHLVIISTIGIGDFTRMALKSNPRGEEIAETAERTAASIFIVPAGAALTIFISILVTAGVFFLILMMVDLQVSFKRVFSVVTYSFCPYLFVTNTLAVSVVALREDHTAFNLNEPIASNLSFLLDPTSTNAFFYIIVSSLDLFSFWLMFLLATGFTVICRKLTMGRSCLIVVTVWVLYVFSKAVVVWLS